MFQMLFLALICHAVFEKRMVEMVVINMNTVSGQEQKAAPYDPTIYINILLLSLVIY